MMDPILDAHGLFLRDTPLPKAKNQPEGWPWRGRRWSVRREAPDWRR